jgi:hypothetical protein
MRRNSMQVGGTLLTIPPKSETLVITRLEYILMLCTNCGHRKSSFVIDASLDKNTWEYLAEKLNQLPRCHCLEAKDGTDSNK